MTIEELLARPFGTVDEMVRHHAAVTPQRTAVVAWGQGGDEAELSFADLDARADGVAWALQRDGVAPGEVIAACAPLSVELVALLVGAFRAGAVVAPLANWLDPDAFRAVLADADPKLLFIDRAFAGEAPETAPRQVGMEAEALAAWIGDAPVAPAPVAVGPETVDLLLYSSGTTGVPKGVAQRRASPWAVKSNMAVGRGVMMVATPSYSTATLLALLSAIITGGTAVVMRKFDARRYLELAERYGATHTSLAPVQYRRILGDPAFDMFDLGAFSLKMSTGAPMGAALKAEILRRWPGRFWEIYGMSEGSCSFRLEADVHPDKLHTVGRPSPGCTIRIVGEDGREVAPGEVGEIVGRSRMMMAGYHGDPIATAHAEWYDAEGVRFVRTGDLGHLDPDGFLVLAGRKRDTIISGGLKIHAIDIERVIETHPDVDEAAVVAARSEMWGETPVAFVVPRSDREVDPEALRAWINGRVGKTQRLAGVNLIEMLPRSPIGKVLKRELRERAPSYA